MKQRKHKILFVLLVSIAVSLQGFALTPAQNLALIENHIFGHENSKMKDSERLNQIEKFVYGTTKSSSTSTRLKQLNSDLGLETEMQSNIASNNDTYNNTQQRVFDDPDEDYANEPVDSSAQYPIVDNIENSLLKQTYKNENIYKRLDRLEQKAYGRISKASLSERVERLSSLVPPPVSKNNSYDDYMANNDEYNYFSPGTNGNPRASSAPVHIDSPQPSAAKSATLLRLEQTIFGKMYTEDSTSRRLSRLEKKMLNKDFSAEPDELRIERLATVANAQQSAQVYKENKLMQHLSTGIQIGGMILMILAMIL